MEKKWARDQEVERRRDEAMANRMVRQYEENRRHNRPEARQARRVRDDLIALKERAEKIVPMPFKVTNGIRCARNLVRWQGEKKSFTTVRGMHGTV
jgi:hypothetical protein